MMKKEKRGILTIFICLLLVAMLSLTGTVIEAVRITGARMQAQAVSDSAADSLLSEYYRPLMEQYQLFFYNGAGTQPYFSTADTASHMQEYMEADLHPEEAIPGHTADFWQLSIDDTMLTSYVLATDNGGEVYRKQAADSVRYQIGEEVIERLKTWEQNPLDFDAISESYEQRSADSEAQIEAAEQETSGGEGVSVSEAGAETAEPEVQPPVLENTDYNPITIIKELKEKGILEFVMQNPQEVSEKRIITDNCVSCRTLQTGIGTATQDERQSILASQEEKVLFHEYLMRQFASAQNADKVSLENGSALAYELEYLIEGEASDVENLKGVVHKLLLLRESVNFAYLLTDRSKQLQAETLAVAITGAAGIAPLATAVKYGILLAWAYGESIMDVRSLLAGGSVALTKSAQTWQLALENIGALAQGGMQTGERQQNGLDYENYLRLLLFAQDEETLTMRSLDLIEKNMKRQKGGECFAADALTAAFTAETVFMAEPLFFSFRFLQSYRQTFTYRAVSSGAY